MQLRVDDEANMTDACLLAKAYGLGLVAVYGVGTCRIRQMQNECPIFGTKCALTE